LLPHKNDLHYFEMQKVESTFFTEVKNEHSKIMQYNIFVWCPHYSISYANSKYFPRKNAKKFVKTY